MGQWNENHFCSPGDCSKCDEFHRFHITLAFRNEHWATILTHHTREDPDSCLIVCGMSHVFKRGKKKWSLLTWLENSGWTITPCEGLKIPAAPQSSLTRPPPQPRPELRDVMCRAVNIK